MKSYLPPLLVVACCAGCGPSVVPGDSTSTSSSGGGQAGTAGTGAGGTAGNAGTGGVGGGTGGTGGIAGSAGMGGLGGFGGNGGAAGGLPDYCAGTDFYFDITGDGADQHYDIKCQPQGYILLGGGPPPHPAPPEPGNGMPPPPPPMTVTLRLDACPLVNTIIMTVGGSIDVPGTSDTASFQYKVNNYGDGTLDITEFGDVGQPIVGDYNVMLPSDPPGPNYMLSGTFRVCRTPDVYLP